MKTANTYSAGGETGSAVTANPGTLCDEHRVTFLAASGQVRFGDNLTPTTRCHSERSLHRGLQRGSANSSHPNTTGYQLSAVSGVLLERNYLLTVNERRMQLM